MNKKTAGIIGIILGIAIIVIGFCVTGISVEAGSHSLSGASTIGKDVAFGADFYTEIYSVTQDVGYAVNAASRNINGAVNNAQQNICGAVERACDAIGWLIVAIGLFDIAYFVCKISSGEDNGTNSTYNVAPAIATPSASPVSPSASPAAPASTFFVPQNEVRSAGADEWKCTCGKIHKNFESSCICGMTKQEAKAAQNN